MKEGEVIQHSMISQIYGHAQWREDAFGVKRLLNVMMSARTHNEVISQRRYLCFVGDRLAVILET
jgi:hypothetical protein